MTSCTNHKQCTDQKQYAGSNAGKYKIKNKYGIPYCCFCNTDLRSVSKSWDTGKNSKRHLRAVSLKSPIVKAQQFVISDKLPYGVTKTSISTSNGMRDLYWFKKFHRIYTSDWILSHLDGNKTRITDQEFKEKYEIADTGILRIVK
jgi:hypothetical protein